MFWFVFIFALLAYGACHITYIYRNKAVESCESKIGLFQPNICPVCRKCKYFIFVTFVITVFTTLIVSYPQENLTGWSFLSLDHNSWEIVQVIIAILFFISVIIYFYIHFEVLTSGIKRLFHIKV